MKQTLLKSLGLCLLLGLVACSSERSEPELSVATEQVAGKTGEVSFRLTLDNQSNLSANKDDVSLAEELRSLNGVKWQLQWLVPNVSDKKVNGVLIISDGTQTTFTEKEFEYDEETRNVFYKGEITLPASAKKGSKLSMRAIVAPDGWWKKNTNTLEIPQQNMAEETDRQDGTELGDLQVAYMSEWIDMTMHTDTYGTPDKNAQLKPIGHVIRLSVRNMQWEMPDDGDVIFNKIGIESNTLSRSGSYNFTGATPKSKLVYTPSASETPYGNNTDGIYYHTMDLDKNSSYRTERVYYLWVHPRDGIQTPRTRGFLHLHYKKPPFDPSLHNVNRPWWLGTEDKDEKIAVAAYSSSDFSTNSGSTMNLRLTHLNALPAISRFTISSLGRKVIQGDPIRSGGLSFMSRFADREAGVHELYSYQDMINMGLLGANGVAPTLTSTQVRTMLNGFYTRSSRLKWRVPTLAEVKMLLAPLRSEVNLDPRRGSFGSIFRVQTLGSNALRNKHVETVSESAALGNRGSATHQAYLGDFLVTEARSDYNTVDGLRFSSNGDRYRHYYRYRALKSGEIRTQIQAAYIGPFYPEITTAEQWVNYKGVKPSIEEQIVAGYNARATQSPFNLPPYGDRVWVSDLSANGNPQYVSMALGSDDNRVVEVVNPSSTDWAAYASAWLIRDFGDLE